MRRSSAALLLALALLPLAARAQPSTQEEQPVTQGKPRFIAPVLLEKVAAEYPPEAFAAGIEGAVILEFGVDENGQVTEVNVKQPAGHGFDEAAVAAVRKFRWKPGTSDNTPVPSKVEYAIKFTIATVKKAVGPTLEPGELPIRIRGEVLARGTRTPIPYAHVFAARSGGATLPGNNTAGAVTDSFDADTDDKGEFILRGLPPGAYTLVITGTGLVNTKFDETLAADTVLTVRYFVDKTWASRYESTVRAAPLREEVSRQTLTTEELVKMPGSMGDPLRAVENLPGVARAPFNTGLLIIRGGKPSDSREFFAGAEVPQLYHFGGFTSVLPAQLIDQVDYFPGNFGVRWGRSIAGAVDLDIRSGRTDRIHGYTDVNAFDAGVSVEGPIGKGSYIVGARRSYIDVVLGAASDLGGLNGVPLSFTTAPVYYDYQAVLDYPLGGGKFRALLMGSDDALKLLFDSPQGDPSIAGSFSTHIFFHRFQLRWTKTKGPFTFLAQNTAGYNGSDGQLGQGLSFDITNLEDDTRVELGYKPSKRLRILVGEDSQLAYTTLTGLLPIPPREGEQPLPLSSSNKYKASETLLIFNIGLYAEAVMKPSPKLTITGGLRYDWFGDVSSSTFNPRMGLKYQLFDLTTIKAGLGLYSQDPQPQDYDKNFGNPTLRPENALHVGLSVEQALFPGAIFEATGFFKWLYDLSAPTTGDVQLDGKVVAERVANVGTGRIYGGEFLLRQALSKYFFGWIAYTLMRSERRNCDACTWHTFDFDQTHILIVALHANLPRGFEAGVRFRYISGFPYTLDKSAYFDADADVYAPGKFAVNTARYDAFNQLDIRFDKTFIFDRWVLKLYLDLTNIYNNPNQEQVQYSYDYKTHNFISGLPFLPSFGIRGEF